MRLHPALSRREFILKAGEDFLSGRALSIIENFISREKGQNVKFLPVSSCTRSRGFNYDRLNCAISTSTTSEVTYNK